MEIKLEKKDWEEALGSAISLLKNALAQVEIYKMQVEVSEKKIAEFPKEKSKKNSLVK